MAKNTKKDCYNNSFIAGKVDFTPTLRKHLSKFHENRLKDKRKHNMYGKKHSTESKLKMSLSHIGKKLSESAKKKISGKSSVAHRKSVKKAKRDWWKKLRENSEKYKSFCKNRASKSIESRRKNKDLKYEQIYEIKTEKSNS